MSEFAVRVNGLGKRYTIGGRQEKYRTLRDSITDTVSAPFRRIGHVIKGESAQHSGAVEAFWALKDVSFDVRHGEVIGIIGANGAGKSTLLKILSRITEPTEGYADVYGRVGALLEVGTGFHSELTGRENIYLNGSILGMSRKDIDRKFDEIVDFAGVEQFIDTPVKHYSSGMGLRLGFAVAAHLEPEILIVDEVLAVGDAAFQKKCLGKMSEVAGEGRTVLFVSHNMAAVASLCTRGILLQAGEVAYIGTSEQSINHYISATASGTLADLSKRAMPAKKPFFRFTGITILNNNDERIDSVLSGQPIKIELDFDLPARQPLRNVSIAIRIEDNVGSYLFTFATRFTGNDILEINESGQFSVSVPHLPLAAGVYRIFLWCGANGAAADTVNNAIEFNVVESDFYGSGMHPNPSVHGSFLVEHFWEYREAVAII
jgi:lipopolysaccharide transport system ATP-binding protein